MRKLFIFSVFLFASVGPLCAAGVPGTTKVVMYSTGTTLSDAQLRAVGGERLRSFDAFVVYRIPSAAVGGLQHVAANVGARLEVRDWDKIALRRATIDTRTTANRIVSDDVLRLFIVQFVAPLASEDEELLRTNGAQYISYIPENAALVLARGTGVAHIMQAPQVQWVSVYDNALKPVVPMPPLANPIYVVQFANTSETTAHIKSFIAQHEILQEVTYDRYANLKVRLDASTAASLADDPTIVAIQLAPVAALSGEREAASVTTIGSTSSVYQTAVWNGSLNLWQPFRPVGNASYRSWLPSSVLNAVPNRRIAIADTGIDNGTCGPHHPDLTNSMFVSDYIGGCGEDPNGHGTMVAGIAAGIPATGPTDTDTSTPSNGTFSYGMGIASGATIYDQRLFGSGGMANTYGGIYTWANDAYNNGAVIQTHSYNFYHSSVAGDYDMDAQAYDSAVRDTYQGDSIDTPMPMTISAGNICGGSPNYSDPMAVCNTPVLSPATAKNVITVGASESYRPGFSTCQTGAVRQPGDFLANSFDNVAYVSRRGTTDGRIKPDILAPGTMVGSTHSQYPGAGRFCNSDTTQMYDIDTGTSFSAPQVAAAALLLDAKYSATFSPAMLKAALIGTAKSMKGGKDDYTGASIAARPNAVQGFGRLFLADIMQGTQSYRFLDESSFTPFTGAGQSRNGTLTVVNQSKPVVLVLAWTDEPGSVSASQTLVRDLDLDVLVGCTLYAGNSLDATTEYSTTPGYCYSTYGHDHKNNVEIIVLPPYFGSSFTYYVTETSWAFGTHNQKFALFAANVL
jgi:Subtilase family.